MNFLSKMRTLILEATNDLFLSFIISACMFVYQKVFTVSRCFRKDSRLTRIFSKNLLFDQLSQKFVCRLIPLKNSFVDQFTQKNFQLINLLNDFVNQAINFKNVFTQKILFVK